MANLWKKATASLLTAALLSGGAPGAERECGGTGGF